MIVSISLSVVSLLFNWALMRRGLLLTGEGTSSFGADLKRFPVAIAALFLALPRACLRIVRGCFA
jgi:hypothetical protein